MWIITLWLRITALFSNIPKPANTHAFGQSDVVKHCSQGHNRLMLMNAGNTLFLLLVTLLAFAKGNQLPDQKEGIIEAAKNGNVETVERLLQTQVPVDDLDLALAYAVKNRHSEVAKLLLEDKRADPTIGDNFIFFNAAENGDYELVKLFLADYRVDSGALKSYAIRMAAENGFSELVKLLLSDERVDPSARDDFAIRKATQNGHCEVVKLIKLHAKFKIYRDAFLLSLNHFSKYNLDTVASLFKLILKNLSEEDLGNAILEIMQCLTREKFEIFMISSQGFVEQLATLSDNDLDVVAYWFATRCQLSLSKDEIVERKDKIILILVIDAQKSKLKAAWRPEFEAILGPLMSHFPSRTVVIRKICRFLNYFWTEQDFKGLPSELLGQILLLAYN